MDFAKFSKVGVRCPCCAGKGADHVSTYPMVSERRFASAVVIWCSRCGSGYVPDADRLLGDYYADAYATENRGDRDVDPATYFAEIAGSKYARRAESHLKLLRRAGARFDRVLDFGAGPGYFLKAAGACEAFAVEPDSFSRKYLDFIGAKVVELDEIEDGSLDVIEASHSLEHLTEASLERVIATFVSKLAPNGLLFAEVPHCALSHLQVVARHEPHTLFFSAQGFRSVMRRSGFEIVHATGSGSPMPKTPSPIYAPGRGRFLSTDRKCLRVIARRPAS